MSQIINPFDHTLKLLHHPKQLNRILEGSRPFPIHLEVDLTNICNHACSFCNMSETLANDSSVIDSEVLLERLAEAYSLGSRSISFTGGGEPTMHPKFSEISERTKKLGFDLGLITNGALLQKSRLEAIAEFFKWVRISLGGVNETIYRNIQGKNDFRKVLDNIFDLKERSNLTRNLDLGIKIMLTQENIDASDELTKNLKKSRLTSNHINYIQFVPDQYTNDGGKFVNSSYVSEKLELLRKQLGKIRIPLYESLYSVDNAQRDLGFSNKCFAHYYQLVITATGLITFCKNSRDTRKLHVGDIYNSTFSEIWQSDYLKELEDTINASNCNTFCKSLKLNNLIYAIQNPSEGYSKNFF